MSRYSPKRLIYLIMATTMPCLLWHCQGESPLTFRLEKTTINLGERPVVTLDEPFKSKEGSTFWFTLEVPGDHANYEHQRVIEPGEVGITLEAPQLPGVYQVSLNESTSMGHEYWVQLETLIVESDNATDLHVTFELNKPTIKLDDELMVSFDKPLAPRLGESYVMTAVEVGAPDEYILNNVFGTRGDPGMWLYTPQSPGNHEVRLLARYPTELDLVIYRRPLVVVFPDAEMLPEESEWRRL
jgi:hypothetical protein